MSKAQLDIAQRSSIDIMDGYSQSAEAAPASMDYYHKGYFPEGMGDYSAEDVLTGMESDTGYSGEFMNELMNEFMEEALKGKGRYY